MRTAYKQMMLGSLTMVLAGCGGGSTGSGNVEFSSALSMKRVYVDEATQEQWESILVACGDNGAMNCAVVCHVPPGNPDNRHTITVGVNAVKAHLRHTHADRKNGAIGDYLGDCNASPDDGDDGGDDDDGGSTGGDTGGGTPTDGGSTGGDTGGGTPTDGGSTGGDTGGTPTDSGGSTGGDTSGGDAGGDAGTVTNPPVTDSGTDPGSNTDSGPTDGTDSGSSTDDSSGYADYYEPYF